MSDGEKLRREQDKLRKETEEWINQQVVDAVMDGEFEKRLMTILKGSPHLPAVLNLLSEAKQDFPNLNDFTPENFLDEREVFANLINLISSMRIYKKRWLG